MYMYVLVPIHTHKHFPLMQLEIWSPLGAILHRSLSNIHMCRQLHLIHHCLDYLRKTSSEKVASKPPFIMGSQLRKSYVGLRLLFLFPGHVTRVIEILGSYSLSLKELRDILSYLYTGQMKTWVSQSLSFVPRIKHWGCNNYYILLFFSPSGTPFHLVSGCSQQHGSQCSARCLLQLLWAARRCEL